MRGRKPQLDNVVPMRSEPLAQSEAAREAAIDRAVAKLRPRGLSAELRREWDRVARMLADPTVDRLKPRFVDTIREYCEVCVRMRSIRAFFADLAKQASAQTGRNVSPLDAEVYRVKGRNGEQAKSHPHVAQFNDDWRKWRSLVAMLGLSPADERNFIPGQGDLFDESEQYFT